MNEPRREKFRPEDLLTMNAEDGVDTIVHHAAQLRVSDLFFLFEERAMTVSVRRLGIVEQLAVLPLDLGRHMINHVKVLAGMDIAESRRPLDGRWILHLDEGHRVDLRVNCIPTLYGQDMTLRVWDHGQGLRTLDQLGMTREQLSQLHSMLNRPGGLILVTGPNGTGKTTTMYACLQALNDGKKKLNTLEDPVEYALPGVRQSQINPRFGLEFPELLRNVLRQSPDVIMIGEIRDHDTAVTAVRAASSGHLVLATLHAPVAATAVQSLLALGAHPHFLTHSLIGVIAQRLLRTLCPECRVNYDISEAPQTFEQIRPLLKQGEGKAIYGPGGCDACYGTGYASRTGLFEVMTVNQELRRLLTSDATREEIEAAAIRNGMVEFRRGALLKVARGETSTEEMLRDVPAEFLGLED